MNNRAGADLDEIRAILQLMVGGLPARQLRALLQHAGSGSAILARRRTLLDASINANVRSLETRRRVDSQMRWIETTQVHVLVLGCRDYPEPFTHLVDPPPVVFARGRLSLLDTPIIAIVGTRRCTPYGADVARQLASLFVRAGVTVASGLARGIDGIAHTAAFEAGGSTIAVLGTGLDVCYPSEHRPLQERIAQEGLLLTEFAPGTGGLKFHFPARNRLIAVMSRGVVVVEAPPGSGALGTADHALDVGVDVFAVPGPIGRRESTGTNELLRSGAGFIASPEDVLNDLHIPLPPAQAPAAPPLAPTTLEGRLLAELPADGMVADELADRMGMAPAETLALLLEMEVAGAVRRLPGLRFAPVAAFATGSLAMG